MSKDDFLTRDEMLRNWPNSPLPMHGIATTPDRVMVFVTGILAATIFQIGTFILGLYTNTPLALGFILLSAGASYVCAFVQLTAPAARRTAIAMATASILAGAIGGLLALGGLR